MKNALFNGIDGTEGRVPFGAIVSVGVKADAGNPTRTDRFFLLSTGFEELRNARGGGFAKLRHPLDQRFAPFNDLPDGDKRSSVVRGNLMFAAEEDSLNYHLVAKQLGKPGRAGGDPPGGGVWETPPRAMPACVGDGHRAQRFNGMINGRPSFLDIACPNDLCAFRQGPAKICGAFGRLYFRIRWPEGNGLPSLLVRYQTHGWRTVENMLGMFQAVRDVAEGLEMPEASWSYVGLPFEMSVGYHSQPDQGRRFPVVSFAVEDIAAFLADQVSRREHLLSAPRSVALIGDGSQHDESTVEALGEAIDTITPGDGIPASEAMDAVIVDDEPETITKEQGLEIKTRAKAIKITAKELFHIAGVDGVGRITSLPADQYQAVIETLKDLEANA